MIYYAPQFFLHWNTLGFRDLEKISGAHTFGLSVFIVSKTFNKVFTTFILRYPVSYAYKQTWACKALATFKSTCKALVKFKSCQ